MKKMSSSREQVAKIFGRALKFAYNEGSHVSEEAEPIWKKIDLLFYK